MTRDPNCVFCRIVAGELPVAKVFENDAMIAFLDINPLAEGHLLAIPKPHCESVVDLPSPVAAEMATFFPTLGRVLLTITGAQGFNLLINNGSVAGQVVPHAHFHFIPRREGDGLGYRWNAGSYEPGRVEELADAYRSVLADPA